jgi:hypothetical protein
MAWETVSDGYVLKPGERAEFVYRITGAGYLQAVQVAIIESKLKSMQDIRYLGHSIPAQGEGYIAFRVEAKEPGEWSETPVVQAGIHVVVISAAILGAALFAWLSLHEIRVLRHPETAGGGGGIVDDITDTTKAGFTMVTVLAVAVVAWLIFGGRK